MFRRYADDGAAIADLRRWLTAEGVRTRTGKERWDRSVIWGMLRNPAYAGTAVFGKTQAVHEPAGLNRTARLAGRTVPRQVRVQDRPEEEWTHIPVPALVDEETFDRVQQRLEDNKRFASRNTKVPSLLQGLAACASCGYGYYRTSTTTTARKKIYYYRCLGSDDYRYQGGRVCQNKPVRADYADQVVWDHVTALLADPALIRAEIGKRLERARTSDPVTRKRGQLEQALAKSHRVDRRHDHRVLRAAPDHRRAPRPRSNGSARRSSMTACPPRPAWPADSPPAARAQRRALAVGPPQRLPARRRQIPGHHPPDHHPRHCAASSPSPSTRLPSPSRHPAKPASPAPWPC